MTSAVSSPPAASVSRATRWHGGIALTLVLSTVAAGVVTVFGLAPWLFLATFGASGTYLLAPLIGWGRAAWSTAVFALFAASWILVINPYVGVRLDIATIAVLASATVALLIVLRNRSRGLLWALPRVRVLEAVAVVLPAAVSAAGFYAASIMRGMPLSWAMLGDAQFNTVLSRHVATGNGETLDNVQVLSLAQGLMAIVHLPGREQLADDDLLIHDIASQATLWILMILLSSVLAGAIAERVLRQAPRFLRLFGILASAVLPLTWHMTGYAMESGFYNVSLAFLALELSLYFWLTNSRSPLWASSALLVITVIMLGSWTPMAIIPLSLAAWSGWQGLRLKPTRTLLAVWTASVVQLAAFVAIFIVPGFISKSAILSANGTILPLDRELYIAITAATVLIALAVGTVTRNARTPEQSVGPSQTFGLGVALIAISAGVGTAYLVFQNRQLPDPWIYYPIKFAWISMEMMILMIFIGTCLLISNAERRRLVTVIAAAAATVSIVSVLQMNPPRQPSTAALFPLVSLAKNYLPFDATLPLLTSVSGEKIFFSRYLGTEMDTFMNQWQFQITARDEFTPIRGFAYRVVSTSVDVCAAAGIWGGGVQVITADAAWADTLNARCGLRLTAVVRPPLG